MPGDRSRAGRFPAASGGPARPLAARPADQLAMLNEVARLATEDLELQPMLQRISEALARSFDCEHVAIARVDAERHRFVYEALTASAPTEVHVGYSRELGSGVVGEVAATGRSIVIDDVAAHRNYVETMTGAASELCVPVRHRAEVVAILNLESRRIAHFKGLLPVIETVADQVAGAIAGARLFEEIKRRAADLEALSEVSRLTLEAGGLGGQLDRLVRYIQSQFDLFMVAALVADEDLSHWEHRAFASRKPLDLSGRQRWPVSAGVVGRAIATGEVQLVPDVRLDPDYFAVAEEVVAEVAVPILVEGRVLGALNLESDHPGVFSAANLALFKMLASQVTGAIHLTLANRRLGAAAEELADANRRLQEANEALRLLSLRDELTGIANRRRFDDVLDSECRRARRAHEPVAVALIDVDCFKEYNDAYGHQRGDACLRRVAECLRGSLQRAGDLVARYGGEEFAVILPGLDLGAAAQAAEWLRSQIEALGIRHRASAIAPRLTISAGVASAVPDHRSAPERLLAAADRALYQAKSAGRNRVSPG
ncbi:MAG TPA: sensor domain-containing diguanylate cyclase [Thermoanaerobaculia bacterium]|nr:sensor domain-containing diguanylate cyclase [Thermoanaerobaculia bacterium]